MISKAGKPIADLVPHRAAPVTIGGLKGQLHYDDSAFDVDPLTVPANLADVMGDQGLGILDVTGQHAEGLREFPELVRYDPVRSVDQFSGVLRTAPVTDCGRLGRDFIVDSTQ